MCVGKQRQSERKGKQRERERGRGRGGVGSMWLGEVTVLNLLNNTFNSLALFRHPSP